MLQRAVITGLGTISAAGANTSEFWQALVEGRTAITGIPSMDNVGIRIGAMIADHDSTQHFTPEVLGLLDRHAEFAVIAAREATADAGLTSGCQALDHAAVIIGTGCGGKCTDEEIYASLYKQGRKRAHPLTIPRGMPSASASVVSRDLGAHGPAFVVSTACASGAHAVAQGLAMIRSGQADVVITGAADAPFTYGLLKAWESLKITSDDTCRPFCKDRSGIVLGEGAGVVVLESARHARERGAHIYAELAGAGMTSDAGHITRPELAGITGAMQQALRDSSCDAKEIGYINAHGTATMVNDVVETEAIREVFSDHAAALAISSTKAIHGHALGAASALELIATTLVLHHNIIPPTANFTEADDRCDLDYVPNHSREQEIAAAMTNSFAFGGLNAVLVIREHDSSR